MPEQLRGQAFGLSVRASDRVAYLAAPPGLASRTVTIQRVASDPVATASGLVRVVERRTVEGELVVAIDRSPGGESRIEAPGHGLHLVSAHGQTVQSVVGDEPEALRYRLLFAQVLPIAAALQGVELLHAGAVAIDGHAIALVAASGTGKSSLVAELVAGGARFVTDDVLAVENTEAGVVAFPGPAYARLHAGSTEKIVVEPTPIAAPVPLAAACFVERGGSGTRATFEAIPAPDPRMLLTATFVPHLTDAERLVAQLDAAAAIARTVPCLRMRIPDGVDAAGAAACLRRELAG